MSSPSASPYPSPYAQPTNALAIVALVLSLVGVSIGGVITGHISLSQIRRSREQGRGLALAGLIIGYAGCAGWLLFWAIWLAAFLIPLIIFGTMDVPPAQLQS